MSKGWRWLLIIVLLLGLALALQAGLVAFAGYVLLGVYLLSRYLAKSWITSVSIERVFEPGQLEVGDSRDVVLKVHNAGKIPVGWVLVEELLPELALKRKPPAIAVKGRRIAVLFIKADSTKTMKFTLTFNSRGYYQIGPSVIETGDVFGLHRRHRVLTTPGFVLVYPKILPISSYNFASERPIGEIRLANMLYEDPTRTAGVRPYQMGDPLQRIHWRATARTGTLHSRIYEPTTLAGATVLVDFHQAGYPKRGEPYRSDLAVTVACSIAYAVSLLNQQIGFASNGRDAAERVRSESIDADTKDEPDQGHATRSQVRDRFETEAQSNRLRPVVVPTRRGFDQFQQIREVLARLELTDGKNFAEMVFEVASRLPKDATLIAILPKVPVDTAVALGMLKKRGFAVSAILVGVADEGSDDRAQAAGRLMAETIRDVRFVNTEEDLLLLGGRGMGGPSEYKVAVDLI